MNVVDSLLQTDSGIAGLLLRLTLAVVIFPHGVQKALGWFGHGFKGTMKYFTDSGIPTVFALLAIAAEFLGHLGLQSDCSRASPPSASRASCLSPSLWCIGRMAFSSTGTATKKAKGIEYHLLAVGIAITLVIVGGGVWSLDGVLANAG